MIGRQIAHYRITEKIGAGGMGEVYRAEDTKLSRDVALKILPAVFASDADRMARFEREAQLLASLNHPNIAAIYGVEEAEGTRCLVLELIEGQTVDERQQGRPLPAEEAYGLGRQIAEALETAHEKGIIHRDLKPANVKINREGTAKVLDFGLAKALEGDAGTGAPSDLSLSPTLTVAATQAGVILGTASYMSPEQARGRAADKRADIWSFGVVLFEMLTGRRAFSGETISDTLASVLKETPDWSLLPDDLPDPVRELLARCLEKDPRQRLRDMGEARITLERALRGPDATAIGGSLAAALPPEPATAAVRRRPWLAAVVVVGIAAGLAGWLMRPSPPAAPLRRLSLPAGDLWSFFSAVPRISRDGRRVAYIAGDRLHVRELSEFEAREVEDSDGARAPFWSWDSQELGFTRNGKVWRVRADGGKPTVICDEPRAVGAGLAWGAGDRIVMASQRGPLYQVSSRGGDPRPILEPIDGESIDFHHPSFLPDGQTLLYAVHRSEVDLADTLEVLTGEERKTVLTIPEHRLDAPTFAAPGYLLYRRAQGNDGIWATPFSPTALEVTGEASLIDPDGGYPSASADGTLIYRRGSQGPDGQLVWTDREGRELETIGSPQAGILYPSLSPDGGRVAVAARDDEAARDIWVFEVERGTRLRLSFDSAEEFMPEWSPDGTEVIFSRREPGGPGLYVKPADGTAEARFLAKGLRGSFSLDGQYILYDRNDLKSNSDLYYVPAAGGEEVIFLQTEHDERDAALSPDGTYLAYTSDESGRDEVYLKRFPGGEGKWQVSVDGGFHPRWSPLGDEIVYADPGSQLMSVRIATEPSLRLDAPVVLRGEAGTSYNLYPRMYDLSPDGRQLLLVKKLASPESMAALIVTENWVRALD